MDDPERPVLYLGNLPLDVIRKILPIASDFDVRQPLLTENELEEIRLISHNWNYVVLEYRYSPYVFPVKLINWWVDEPAPSQEWENQNGQVYSGFSESDSFRRAGYETKVVADSLKYGKRLVLATTRPANPVSTVCSAVKALWRNRASHLFRFRRHVNRLRVFGRWTEDHNDVLKGISEAMEGVLIDMLYLEHALCDENTQAILVDMAKAHDLAVLCVLFTSGDINQLREFFVELAAAGLIYISFLIKREQTGPSDSAPLYCGKNISAWRKLAGELDKQFPHTELSTDDYVYLGEKYALFLYHRDRPARNDLECI